MSDHDHSVDDSGILVRGALDVDLSGDASDLSGDESDLAPFYEWEHLRYYLSFNIISDPREEWDCEFPDPTPDEKDLPTGILDGHECLCSFYTNQSTCPLEYLTAIGLCYHVILKLAHKEQVAVI